MKLKKLLKNIPVKDVKGSKDIEITGLSSNSKLVAPGHLFVAKKGYLDDGAKYIPEAVESGASAILTDIFDPSFKGVTQIIHPAVHDMEGRIAAEFYHNPSHELFMVGITGTNGKTTTSFLLKHLLEKWGETTGLIGTIEYIIGNHRYQATRTTPDVLSNHKMLREMVLQGGRAAIMEVTSHALDQSRVSHIDFDVAIFTNLSLDHLDYHGTMEAYAAAKRKLFLSLNKRHSQKKYIKTACLNIDSPWAETMKEGVSCSFITYSCLKAADLSVSDINLTSTGTSFTVSYKGKKYKAETPLAGRYNVYNAMGAVAAMLARGCDIEKILSFLPSFPTVPGRLELVKNPLDLKIFVDFAHSDDALLNVLESFQEFKKGKIITVFGCGGDRDKSKRPKMAEVAEEFSDLSIVTNDNPRSEDPDLIARDIIKGFRKKDSYIVELDRRQAIKKAIERASPEDIILIAGKGHENYQIFAHKTIEFDDRHVAYELAQNRDKL